MQLHQVKRALFFLELSFTVFFNYYSTIPLFIACGVNIKQIKKYFTVTRLSL